MEGQKRDRGAHPPSVVTDHDLKMIDHVRDDRVTDHDLKMIAHVRDDRVTDHGLKMIDHVRDDRRAKNLGAKKTAMNEAAKAFVLKIVIGFRAITTNERKVTKRTGNQKFRP